MEAGGDGPAASAHDAHPAGAAAEKSYQQLLQHKSAQLGKEALLEQRTIALTRHFLTAAEEEEQARRGKELERSKQDYERSQTKLKKCMESQELLQQVVREEKSQVFGLMQDKGKQRADEEAQLRAQKSEREKWIQARSFYEQMQAEERQNGLDQREQERRERIEQKFKAHREGMQRVLEEQEAEKAAALTKKREEEGKATERRRKHLREAQQAQKDAAQAELRKQSEAEQRRQQRAEEITRSAREAAQRRGEKVREQDRKRHGELKELERKLLEKAELLKQRRDVPRQQPQDTPYTPRAQPSTLPAARGDAPRSVEPDQDEAKPQEGQVPRPHLSSWSRELVDANIRAQKGYVQECARLQRDADRMASTKKFKALADAARGDDQKGEGVASVRIKALHSMYIAKTPREPRTEKQHDSPRRESSRTLKAQGRQLCCGLCEREFPSESLVGTARRRIVQRFQHEVLREQKSRDGHGPPDARGGLAGDQLPKQASADPASNQPPRENIGLYDHEVRLCVSCYHFIRIASI